MAAGSPAVSLPNTKASPGWKRTVPNSRDPRVVKANTRSAAAPVAAMAEAKSSCTRTEAHS